ncbi:hypothetical protein F53441_6999 [Fusarium austroafricanum]|uniref:TauD/TfdA-like domain-containing protein n=1 Tax=Fusarium austroafricanum TaxID=2364996 RepID=A0A8H4NSQ6_9HYPO|nr:hypothetical protein F53441_6999 [Fusarium austroafricanum]
MFSRLARVPGLSSRPLPLNARCLSQTAIRFGRWNARPSKYEPDVELEDPQDEIFVRLTDASRVCVARKRPILGMQYRTFQCVNPDTKQRLVDTFQLSEDLHPVKFEMAKDELFVEWSDNHKSQHPWPYLYSWFQKGFVKEFGKDHTAELWDSSIGNSPPQVPYDAFFLDGGWKALSQLTRNILVHGFCFVKNAPAYPESTQDLLARLGPVRTTHYGGFYDFTPNLAKADLAYTNVALPAHTDTTYFSEPAGLQAFHLLSHKAPPGGPENEPLGGESLLVDGFHVAKILKKEDPDAYRLLSTIELPWHASGNPGISITPNHTYPVIELERTHIQRIRWNNEDRGSVNPTEFREWFNAARKWTEILHRKESEYWFQLEPGTIIIFNNWRVLHGRRAFTGIRRICGAYIPYDDFMSTYRVTNTPGHRATGRHYNNRTRMKNVGFCLDFDEIVKERPELFPEATEGKEA